MREAVAVLNAGSSSVKFALHELSGSAAPRMLLSGSVEPVGPTARLAAFDARGAKLEDAPQPAGRTHAGAARCAWEWLEGRAWEGATLVGAGHRVVHGGERFRGPALVDSAVLAELKRLTPLAPLHQGHNLSAIAALRTLRPELPQVACFDTAFHLGQTEAARAFALPHELSSAGIKRYGFHGLSYEHVASVLPAHLGVGAQGRVIVAHLGSGASMCAMRGLRSIAATTGFSALDGLPMGTRCGAIDPGALLYLLQEKGMSASALSELLWRRSGLLGMSGISADMRELLHSAAPAAATAIDVFVYRAGREIGSLAAALGGLDALVFTGGIGEHSAPIRSRICAHAAWLGVSLDEGANRDGRTDVGAAGSRVRVLVIRADEEAVIAAQTARLCKEEKCPLH